MSLTRVLFSLSIFVLLCALTQGEETVFTPRDPPKAENAYFQETFKDLSNWVVTEDPNYNGTWRLVPHPGFPPYGEASADSLLLVNSSQRHAISTVFPKPIDNTDKTLVVQYEVRAVFKWTCGGAYIKLYTYNESSPFDPKTVNGQTPYTVMFGPDTCGSKSGVHFIIRHVNPVSKEVEEKHLKTRPASFHDELTHIYTLVIRPDNTFTILVDGEEGGSGNLLEDFKPPVNPSKIIDDPNDKKPSDWVDEEEILDLEATKPADWVEDAVIPDPSAVKPDDWDDEEDGEWEAPTITNPDYVGEWVRPKIPNPEYKGEWKPKQIPNPNYFEDFHPHNLQKIAGAGFELWTVDGGYSFGNILITNDESEASEWRKVFQEKKAREQVIKANRFKQTLFETYFEIVKDFAEENPIVVGVAIGLPVLLILVVVITRSGSKPVNVDEKKKNDGDDQKDNVEKEEETEIKETETKAKQETKRRKKQSKKDD